MRGTILVYIDVQRMIESNSVRAFRVALKSKRNCVHLHRQSCKRSGQERMCVSVISTITPTGVLDLEADSCDR